MRLYLGVLGTTGIETIEVVKGIVDNLKPKLIIAVDSLCSKNINRIGKSIQISDTGIVPGGGEGNRQEELSQKTLGIPVIGIGIPTVLDAATIVIDTLNDAISKRKDVHGLIIHSDQGFQYTSYEYKAICESNGITISMSRKGTPIDDAPIESWHALLKKETLYNNNITSLQEYQKLVEDWILFYNTDRLKSKKLKK